MQISIQSHSLIGPLILNNFFSCRRSNNNLTFDLLAQRRSITNSKSIASVSGHHNTSQLKPHKAKVNKKPAVLREESCSYRRLHRVNMCGFFVAVCLSLLRSDNTSTCRRRRLTPRAGFDVQRRFRPSKKSL